MKLPSDVVIAEEKLTRYLLVWRDRNDKSGYLAQAGYDLSNWGVLDADLRRLAVTAEAESLGHNLLRRVACRSRETPWSQRRYTKSETVWIRLALTNEIRFVTLFPDKE
jgi:hypothetical protein